MKHLFQITSDRLFHVGTDRTVRLVGKHIAVYMYYYTYRNHYGLAELLAAQTSDLIGVSHGDDVLLLYSVEPLFVNLTDGEKLMQTQLLDMYESYTATG